MQCRSCGAELSSSIGAAYCPMCGAIAPDAEAEISPNEYTEASSSATPLQAPPPPPTYYGSLPYDIPQQTPYSPGSPSDSYATSMPPPPSSSRPKVRVGFLIGAVVLVLILVSAGVVALVGPFAKSTLSVKTTTPPTSTAPLETIPYPPYRGRLALNDPLRDNSKGYAWDEGTRSDGSFCKFLGSAYHANQVDPQHFNACIAEATNFSNFAFEVQMTILKGGGGGMIFRADNATGNLYYLRILQSGNYILSAFGSVSTTLVSGSSSAIKTGLNQINQIAVVADGSTFDFYVNSQKINSISDTLYTRGAIGVTADYAPAEVVYSNARVWEL